MAEFVHFKNACGMRYPVGEFFKEEREGLTYFGGQITELLLISGIYCVINQKNKGRMEELIALIFLFYLIWVHIRYDPKLDRIKIDETPHIILWYNSYDWDGKVERKYITLF